MKASVLCYNLKGTKKGKQIAMIFGFLGYKIRHVEKEEYGLPLKVLAGMGEVQEQASGSVDGFSEEMLVMNPAGETMLDKALFLMRKESSDRIKSCAYGDESGVEFPGTLRRD